VIWRYMIPIDFRNNLSIPIGSCLCVDNTPGVAGLSPLVRVEQRGAGSDADLVKRNLEERGQRGDCQRGGGRRGGGGRRRRSRGRRRRRADQGVVARHEAARATRSVRWQTGSHICDSRKLPKMRRGKPRAYLAAELHSPDASHEASYSWIAASTGPGVSSS
jgi:hypothetical protein